MIPSQKTQTLDFAEDINNLLCQIDVKISEISKQELDSKRYGFCYKTDTVRYFILANYRKILLEKANNNCCLKSYLIDDIINVVKQYLTSNKIIKLQTSESLAKSKSSDTKDIVENGINMTIIYQNYGDNIVHNSSYNRFINETQDTWDSQNW